MAPAQKNRVAGALEASLDGRKVTVVTIGDEERDVVLTLPKVRRDQLMFVPFTTSTGQRVVLGDVAGVQSQDIDVLLHALPERGVVVAPSSDGGTSALLRRPRDVIAAGFGPGSAALHHERALRAGVFFQEISLASLSIDVDERVDLEKLVHSSAPDTQTRALLRELLPELRA